MMRLKLILSLVAAVFSTVATETIEVEIGDEVPLVVRTLGSIVDGCFLVTPHGETIEFKTKNDSVENRYVLLEPNLMSECQVSVTIVDENDTGLWSLYFTSSGKKVLEDNKNIVVKGLANAVSEIILEFSEGSHLPLMVNTVGVEFDGCYLETPQNEIIEFKPKDQSVSNRYQSLEGTALYGCKAEITIFDEKDSGTWTIYISNGGEKIREEKYTVAVKTSINYNINQLSTIIRSVDIGGISQLNLEFTAKKASKQSCGIINNLHEVVQSGDDNVSEVDMASQMICRFNVGPISKDMLGEWMVFLRYTRKNVFHEVQQIFNLRENGLDDNEEEDDVHQYAIINRNPETRVVNLDTKTELTVQAQIKNGVFVQCGIRDSTGSLVKDGENGITEINTGSQMTCRYEIGPLTEQMLVEWTVFLRYSQSGQFTEVRQLFDLEKEDPLNPIEPGNLEIRDLEPQRYAGSIGFEQTISITGHKKYTISSCHIRTPDGLQYAVIDGFNIQGVEPEYNAFLCRMKVNIISDNMFGEWMLIARRPQIKNTPPVEERLRVTFVKGSDQNEDEEEDYGNQYAITNRDPETRVLNLGTKTELTVQAQVKRGVFEQCGLRDSTGSIVKDGENGVTEINTGSQMTCKYEIGPLAEPMLGEWTVFLRYSLSGQLTEVRQLFDLQKEDPSNPIQPGNLEIRDLEPQRYVGSIGFEQTISITGHKKNTISSCHIRTPEGLQYAVIDGFNVQGVEPEYNAFLCRMKVNIISDKMFGEWMLIARRPQIKYTPAVEERLRVTIERESAETDGTIIHRLTRINYIVKPDISVEISLRKINHDVSCLLRTPSGQTIVQNNENNPKAILITDKSDYYATCRALIGPIDDSLLGDWELCQNYSQNEQQLEECQPATLAWNNGNPDGHWNDHTQPIFNHPVHYNGVLRTGVSDSATIRTCHVITPEGNNIVINQDSGYPYITRLTPLTQCSISIGPIDAAVLGDWVVYGTYSGFQGVSVRRLPIHMFLYDPENPYEQAYNVTNLNPVVRTINLGTSIDLEVQVSANRAVRNACLIRSPGGYLVEDNSNAVISVDVGSRIACQYRLGPISESTLGDWEVSLKYQLNNMFTEVRQVFVVQREDPKNPILDERPVEYLPSQYVNALLGSTHEFSITGDARSPIEDCHLRTPDGLQYKIMEGLEHSGIEATATSLECRVTVNVYSTSMLGEWTLIARKPEVRHSPAMEERLNFTIFIEEQVRAMPDEINIYENNDLLLRLADATNLYNTCKLYGPDGNEYTSAEKNPNYPKQCGFIVTNVSTNLNGTWLIVYGDEITYKAFVDVFIHSTSDFEFQSLTWNMDDQFSGFIGPENIKYCKVMDPRGLVVYDSFGRCHIDVNRITHRHNGTWVVSVGLEGKMELRQHSFTVAVRGIQTASAATVKTSVETTSSMVVLSCSVITSEPMDVCKFQHDSGRVLIPTMGVSEDKYSFFGDGSRSVAEGFENNCGIRISNPTVDDWGIWRCAISTPVEVIYGFLSAVSSTSIKNGIIANKSEPMLKINNGIHQAIQGEEVIISCNIMAPIHYCYFRNSNGTVYSLYPGVDSETTQYYGAGLAAGECGIRFKSVTTKESGVWSCNVGFSDLSEEQTQQFDLIVSEQLQIEQFETSQLIVKARVSQYNDQTVDIEHCRYVRIDAFAFTSHNPPVGYTVEIENNECYLFIDSPSILDHHPWSVAVRVQGRDEELSGTSRSTLPDSSVDPPPPSYHGSSFFWFWTLMLAIMVLIPIIVMTIAPKKHRDWTYDKFSTLRRSFRSGVRIAPEPFPINNVSSGIHTEKVPVV